MGNSRWPDSHCGSICFAAENTKFHHSWKRHYVLEFAMGCPTGMGEGRTTVSKFGLSLLQTKSVEIYYTWNGTTTSKEGSKWESLV